MNSLNTHARRFLPPTLMLLALAALTMTGFGQSLPAWTALSEVPAQRVGAERWVAPERGALFQLDASRLKESLTSAVAAEPYAARATGVEVTVPMPDGTLMTFRVVESSVMAPELAAKFPEIKTYAGEAAHDSTTTIRLDLTPQGFHAQILSPDGAVYVDPAFRGDTELHVSYHKRDHRRLADDFRCLIEPEVANGTVAQRAEAAKTLFGATLRTYRLACAATGEYTQFHGGTVPFGQAAIVTAINRINGIYERELAVRLVLVANNDLLVYTSGAGDPYSNTSGGTMLGQNQSNVDTIIGSANYDIGHVFSTGGGGIASLGSVCSPTRKAQGVTGSASPTGDSFWVDYVAHEMGHQFGGNHTFNSTSGSCGGGNRNSSTAYEPGSGSTIMAYAGICSPNDLQRNSDAYFHTGNLTEMQAFILNGATCGVGTATGNNAPTVNAGLAYTIPAGTPFALTATGSDPDSDTLTYCWEEMDLGAATALTDPDNGSSPLFRSLSPTTNATRYFPKLSSVLANTNWNQEILPTTSRTMKFRVTARDNRAGGGGLADADTQVTVVSAAGPFRVTAPNTAVVWSNAQTVTWNVAGTTASPINAPNVNIYLSTNGGLTFPIVLASNVPNSGSQAVFLPNLSSTQARVKVQGNGNIFYDVSDANFTVLPGLPVPLLSLESVTVLAESCQPGNANLDPGETVTVDLTLRNAGSAPTTNLLVTWLATNGASGVSAAQDFGAIPSGGTATRSFTLTASGNCGENLNAALQLTDGGANLGTLIYPIPFGAPVVVTQVFASTSSVTINTFGSALPYPSVVNVAGVSGALQSVTLELNGLTHTRVADVNILAVGPGGQTAMLVGRVGSSTASGAVLTFDDNATNSLPLTGAVTSGTYLPTDYNGADVMNSPAPARPYGTNVAALATTPNGAWNLFVQDFQNGRGGSINGGWSVKFVTQKRVCCVAPPAPTLLSTTYGGQTVDFRWDTAAGFKYQVQYRTNLAVGDWQNLGALITGAGGETNFTDNAANSAERYYRVLVSP